MTNKIKLIWQSFESLTKDQLYDILNLRQKVFIIEQDCFYEDIDYFDQKAHHLLIYCNKSLIGYARVFPPGIKYKSSSIGRIVVDKKYRGESFGKKITQEAIIFLKDKFINSDVCISAQFRLVNFYENLGFETEGEVYLEDGIDHIKMIYQVSK